MKVKELLDELEKLRVESKYEIDDWDIAIEVLHKGDLKIKRRKESGWKIFKDYEDWEYIKTAGFIGIHKKEKSISINANY